MATNFASLLAVSADSVKKPAVLPAGTYDAVIKGHTFGESKQQKTPFVQFQLQLTSPGPDIDPESFEAFGGISALMKRIQRRDFYLTDDAKYRLKDFLTDACKINLSGRNLGDGIEETTNISVKVTVKHEPSKNGEDIYANVTDIAAAE